MKNIAQILKDAGLEVTEEQKAAVNAAVTENYRTKPDYDKQIKKLEAAKTERDSYRGQLDTANKTLERFRDIDPEKQAAEEEAKQKAAGNAPKFTTQSEPKREPAAETGEKCNIDADILHDILLKFPAEMYLKLYHKMQEKVTGISYWSCNCDTSITEDETE